jgi:hypothetical protein
MPKMTDRELIAIIDPAEKDATIFNGDFMAENNKYLKEYLGEPYGDEVEGQSQVVSTDVADVVESDMPSLARIFMGSGDILTFQPNTENEVEVKEAEEKTKYVNWIVRNQPESFQTLHNWLKDAEIQKNGVVKYFVDDSKEVETVSFEGVDVNELAQIAESLKGADVDKVEIADQLEYEQGGTFDISFRVTKKDSKICIINVPPESFLITKNSTSVNDASLVGDRMRKTRGELVADGFSRDLIDQLPTVGDKDAQGQEIKTTREGDQGGSSDIGSSINDWANESVEIFDLYMKVDYDGDGIAERRHIMKSGNHILINEPFNHVPYASLSAILMPHKAIGRSRAEVTSSAQRQKTVLIRGANNNMHMVNNPRNIVHPDVDLDDMLTVRTNGIVRLEEDSQVLPQNAVFPLQIPYIGDRALQMIQYVDQARAQTTGQMLANQGLDSDAIGRETATRFQGIEKSGEAKIELIARNYAETGFRKLYEGIAWLASRYQNTETEMRVLGKAMTVDPRKWKYSHSTTSVVGLGAGNNEQMVASLQGIYGIQQQLKAQGSELVDSKDIYNTLKRIVDGLGMPRVDEFFNDPEKPEELLQAQNEILQQSVQQLQQMVEQLQNPLADAEMVKREGELKIANDKLLLDVAKLEEDRRQFNVSAAQKETDSERKTATDLTALELKHGQDIEGALV